MTETFLPDLDILSPSPPPPQPEVPGGPELRSAVLGTWRLVSVTRRDLTTGEAADFLGPDPQGYIHYGVDGRMLAVIVRSGRRKPDGIPTGAEAETLLKSVVSYAGTWDIVGNEMIHHVELSWNESWTGTVQRRVFSFIDGRLLLDTPPSPDPVDGLQSVRSLVWERVA